VRFIVGAQRLLEHLGPFQPLLAAPPVLHHEPAAALEDLGDPGIGTRGRPYLHVGGAVDLETCPVEVLVDALIGLPPEVGVGILSGGVTEQAQPGPAQGRPGGPTHLQELTTIDVEESFGVTHQSVPFTFSPAR
jgi:hypothetical protein